MHNIVTRVFLCQMVSLGVMFKELLDLQNRTASNGQCFEDLAGELYIKSILSDFVATLLQHLWAAFRRKLLYHRLVNGGIRGMWAYSIVAVCRDYCGHLSHYFCRCSCRAQGVCPSTHSAGADKTKVAEIRVKGCSNRCHIAAICQCTGNWAQIAALSHAHGLVRYPYSTLTPSLCLPCILRAKPLSGLAPLCRLRWLSAAPSPPR